MEEKPDRKEECREREKSGQELPKNSEQQPWQELPKDSERLRGQELPKDSEQKVGQKEYDGPEGEQPPQERKVNLEFIKGVLFGVLVSGIVVLAFFLIQNGTVGFSLGGSEETKGAEVISSRTTINKLREIENIISSVFLYEPDGELLEEYLFKGLTLGLEDPYASYYTEEELQSITEINEGAYYGIGVTLLADTESGYFIVAGVYEGSSADEAGVEAGDVITQVDGESVLGLDLSEVVTLVKSKEESVKLTLLRNETELEVTVALGSVEVPTVSSEMLEDGIGYLKIAEFDSITVEQFRTALEELEAQGMEKLIVDVRDNPGGLLDAVCDILDDLLPEGLIVYTQDKEGVQEEHSSDAQQLYDKPLAVLVNENSASASEIFAGAIQDYELGPVIGTQTYGKGVVQRTYRLSDGSALKLTAEKYYTPKGQDIDGNGITPDIVVEQAETDESQQAETDEAQQAETDETQQAETDGAQEAENDEVQEETTDLQLQKALEYLKEE